MLYDTIMVKNYKKLRSLSYFELHDSLQSQNLCFIIKKYNYYLGEFMSIKPLSVKLFSCLFKIKNI